MKNSLEVSWIRANIVLYLFWVLSYHIDGELDEATIKAIYDAADNYDSPDDSPKATIIKKKVSKHSKSKNSSAQKYSPQQTKDDGLFFGTGLAETGKDYIAYFDDLEFVNSTNIGFLLQILFTL